LYAILVPGALALTAGMAAFRLTPWPSVAGLLAAPLIPTLIRSARQGDGSSLQRLLGGTARLHLTYGVLVAAGLAVAVAFRQP
jgi:O-antigen/teichoic acid export membrane protein